MQGWFTSLLSLLSFPWWGLLYIAATAGMVNAFALRPPKLAPGMSSSLKDRPQLIYAFAMV